MNSTPSPNSASDIRTGGWIDAYLPKAVRPFMYLARLDRPYGAALLLLPCWWSISLASDGWPSLGLLALFLLGAVIMRGAGCVINDIADRDFDGSVARTATRPIPAGDVTVREAILFFVLLCFIGLGILVQFNIFAIGIGILSIAPLVVYPYTKRFTYWPQFFLGLAFNWGALLGWAAVRGDLSWAPLVLYIAGIFWTLGYDTIYAHQDKEDDALIGIKSTALKFGEKTKPILAVFYTACIALMGLAGWLAGAGPVLALTLIPAALHLAWQLTTLDIHDPKNCLVRFKANRDFGLLAFAGFVAAKALS